MKRYLIVLACIATLSIPFDSFSQSSTPAWWMTNSLKQTEKHKGTRIHAQGEYSTYIATGQVDTYFHKSTPMVFIRDGRAQLSAFGTLSYQKVRVQSNPASRTRSFSFNPKLIYDLNPSLQWEGGVLAEKNDAQYLKLRSAYYTGLIYNNLEHKNLGKLLFVAFGYEQVSTTQLPEDLGTEKFGNPIVYVQQRFNLTSIPKVNLSETLIFIHGIDQSHIYRVDLDLKAMYQFNAHISGMVQYQIKYEEEPLIPDLAPYYEKMNTALTVGVVLNF
jgi:hypothetical protein